VKQIALAAGLLAATIQPLVAQQGPRIAHQPSETRPYSAAVQVGNIYWLSGKLGATAETRAMTAGQTGAETHNIMRSFGELLDDLGMDFSNIVRGVVYLADVNDYNEMNEAYGQYFPETAPSRVAVGVSELIGGARLEISFIAVKN
jgi:2-iminobutanoate/2-iminopropanoate deaminase